MKKNELTTREQLKTYFETGKHPTQSQFSDLLDSLRLKEDALTNKEVAILANSLTTMHNGYIYYSINDIEDQKFSIVVSSKNEEDQVITTGNTQKQEKRYFFGDAPYTIKAKDFPKKGLGKTAYYTMSYQINQGYWMSILFGNNLPEILDGFEFGKLEGDSFSLNMSKIDFGQQINIINTKIKFVNKTEVSIEYKAQGGFWGDKYRTEDSVTNHYNMWDDLTFLYNTDLREIGQSIECKLFDADNESLLMIAYLNAGQNNQNTWGGQAVRVRNIRIECDYAPMN